MLEATISGAKLKNTLKGLQAISEEAILDFNKDGLIVRVVDANRYKLLQIQIKPDGFESFSCEGNHRLGVRLSRIKDITKSLTTKDIITMKYTDKFTLSANDMERTVKLLRLELLYDQKTLPEYEYTFNTEIESSKEIRDYLKTLDKTPVFQVSIDGEEMIWKTLEKEETISWKPDLEINSEKDLSLLFTTQQVADIVAATNKEVLKLRGGTPQESDNKIIPLEFQWSPFEGINMIGMVAPRV